MGQAQESSKHNASNATVNMPCEDTTVSGTGLEAADCTAGISDVDFGTATDAAATAASRDGVELLSLWPPSPEWFVNGPAPLCHQFPILNLGQKQNRSGA